MNYQQVQQFFSNFNLQHGVVYKPLPFSTVSIMIRSADKWFGKEFGLFVADECLIPVDPKKIVDDVRNLFFHFDYPSEYEVETWARSLIGNTNAHS
jgi:hypothetical protein